MNLEDDIAADAALIGPDLVEAIKRYVEHRIEPGSFLMGCLENDLRKACSNADHWNRERLWYVVRYLWWAIPSGCWGSKKRVDDWLNPQPKEEEGEGPQYGSSDAPYDTNSDQGASGCRSTSTR